METLGVGLWTNQFTIRGEGHSAMGEACGGFLRGGGGGRVLGPIGMGLTDFWDGDNSSDGGRNGNHAFLERSNCWFWLEREERYLNRCEGLSRFQVRKGGKIRGGKFHRCKKKHIHQKQQKKYPNFTLCVSVPLKKFGWKHHTDSTEGLQHSSHSKSY